MGFREPDEALEHTVATDADGMEHLLAVLPAGSAERLLTSLLAELRHGGVGAEWLEASPDAIGGYDSVMWDQWMVDLFPYHEKTREYYATLWRIGRKDLAPAGGKPLSEGDPLLAGMLSLPDLPEAMHIAFRSGERDILGLLYAEGRILEISGRDTHWHAGVEPAGEGDGLELNWTGLKSEEEARGLMALAVLAVRGR